MKTSEIDKFLSECISAILNNNNIEHIYNKNHYIELINFSKNFKNGIYLAVFYSRNKIMIYISYISAISSMMNKILASEFQKSFELSDPDLNNKVEADLIKLINEIKKQIEHFNIKFLN